VTARKKRLARKASTEALLDRARPRPPCPECGEPGPHFVPPCFGQRGFYVCPRLYGPDGRRLPQETPE
jgi:hypothetical protein